MRNLLLAALLALSSFTTFSISAAQPPVTGMVYDAAPFNVEPKLFTSRSCPLFDCSQSSSASDRVKLANACAASRFGFPATMLTSYQNKGTFKDCAIPSSFMPKSPMMGANANWPVCCVEEKSGNQCEMTCHMFVSTTYQP